MFGCKWRGPPKDPFHIVPFSNAANEETIAAFVAYAGALAVFLSDS